MVTLLPDVIINTKDLVINICFNIIFRTLALTYGAECPFRHCIEIYQASEGLEMHIDMNRRASLLRKFARTIQFDVLNTSRLTHTFY